jgi:hypothetical protein
MPKDLHYKPPQFHFDDRLATQLARPIQNPPAEPLEPERAAAVRRSPFADYARLLTPEGGILILYRDRASGWLYTVLRTAVWIILTVTELRLLSKSSMSAGSASIAFLIVGSATLFLVTRKITIRHSVEIRHDRMILDGKHVFWAEDIGPNLPQLEIKDQNNPNRMVIAGICGTRFVEYMTANRLDDNDRTPEVLIADLQDAIQQLWARDEMIFG